MPTKTITIATNFNGKLSCAAFLHIDAAPLDYIRESVLADTDILIRTLDGSHPPVQARLVDVCRQPLWELSSIVTWASHGMDQRRFIEWITTQNQTLGIVSKMCVYIYQKIN